LKNPINVMNNNNSIDTAFDFRSDTPKGKDPDTWSPTLCRYHKLLWSKPLPKDGVFHLEYGKAPFYLRHSSGLGEFCLSSDTVIPTFKKRTIKDVPDDIKNFGGLGYTIGGMMLFPANQIQGKWTINQARGCTREIRDRFDLTLECIRRHYSGGDSPLSEVFARYQDFFSLFRDFCGYVEFFLLHDLITDDGEAVRFFTPFDDFKSSPVPDSRSAYLDYRESAVEFLKARNRRIRDWSESNLAV
jgi:hypothetical protein